MTTVLIFDTEATGLEEPELIEAAWLRLTDFNDEIPKALLVDDRYEQRFKPLKPITYGAMAVHNILPHELEDCAGSDMFRLSPGVDYLVGHNIDFDWGVIGRPDVKRICTDAIARYVWPNADSFSQSALLYMLLGPTDETRQMLRDAHSAMADVINLAALLEMILRARPAIKTWAQLYEYSEECRIPLTCPFSQYRGVLLTELAVNDPGYCNWMLRQDWLDDYLRIGVERAMYGGEV